MYIDETTKNITNNTPTNSINDISSDISDFYTVNLHSVSIDDINSGQIKIEIIKTNENENENETVVKVSNYMFRIIIFLLVISPAIIAVLIYVIMYCI
jgi:hypothetical protein